MRWRLWSAVALQVTCMGGMLDANAGDREARPAISWGLEEIRGGAYAHNVDRAGSERGTDVSGELLFSRLPGTYENPRLDRLLRPRLHIGTLIITTGETNRAYAG